METSINNKCKAFTSLEQSKKLAEILPLKSADMWYWEWPTAPKYNNYEHPMFHKGDDIVNIPCWSLAALLDIMPDRIDDSHFLTLDKEGKEYCCCYEDINGNSFKHEFADNAIDACVEMIVKLKEERLI